jgi:hypothetical protein
MIFISIDFFPSLSLDLIYFVLVARARLQFSFVAIDVSTNEFHDDLVSFIE